jgi:hypothetical protein
MKGLTLRKPAVPKKFDAPYFYEVPDGEELKLPTFDDTTSWFGGRKRQYNKLFRGQQYASVVAFTILREGDNGPEVLAGPRNPETNKTHPNVVSVPTKREDVIALRAAALACGVAYQSDTEQVFVPKWIMYEHPDDMERDMTLGNMVGPALARKVGFEDLLFKRTRELKFNVQSLTLGQSFVDYNPQTAMQTKEGIGMLNVAVIVPSGTEAPSPAAYSMLKWFGVDAFQDGYHNKDAMGMFPEMGLDAIEMCVHGVCMLTTSRALDRGIGMMKPAPLQQPLN